MAQKIELNGHTFRVWFNHVQNNNFKNEMLILDAIQAAVKVKQIKLFGQDNELPNVKAATVCTIETNDGKHEVISTGYSFCSASEQRFVKSDSRNRALGRAIGAYWKSVGGKVRVRS